MSEDPGDEFQRCFRNVFCVQRWGMTLGSCISVLAIAFIWLDCWQHEHLRSLVRRPIAPLLYRSACNFVFAAQFIIAHLFLTSDSVGGPDRGLEFTASTCTNLAFVTQVTLLASECWYFVVSLDVVTDLFFSPFNNAIHRIAGYHVFIWTFSICMAVVLVTTDEAGQSPVFAWCWRKSFADEGQSGEERGILDFLYLYGPVVIFYMFSLVVWFLARFSLNKGIPRTYRVREQRIQQGKGIVVGFSLYWTVFGGLYTIVLFADNAGSKTTGYWLPIWFVFSLLLCSRGLIDHVVWKLYIKPAEGGKNMDIGFLTRVCCGCWRCCGRCLPCCGRCLPCCRGGPNDMSARLLTVDGQPADGGPPGTPSVQSRRGSSSGSGSSSSGGAGSGRGGGGNPAELPSSTAMQAKEDEFTDVGLNAALREELLFWTMLGMRTASQQAHEEWITMDKERGHGRIVDAVDIDLRAALHEDGAVRDTLDSANSLRRSYSQAGMESPGSGPGGPGGSSSGETDEDEFRIADLDASMSSSNVQFVDYCSFTFHAFRTSAGLLPESYKTSLARPRNSRFKLGGTSGAFIFFSDDNRFVIKQIQTNEFNTLLKILPSYLKHMRTHPESMLQHMYQLCSCTMYHHTLYFLVVGNVHHTAASLGHELHERYDLKGSWINRNAPATSPGTRVRCRLCHDDFIFGQVGACPKRPAGFQHVPDVTMKDMDLNYKLPMSKEKAAKLSLQLAHDTAWLCSHDIVDYSLYLGVHKRSYDVNMSRNASFRLSSAPDESLEVGAGPTPFFTADDGGIGAVFVEGPAVFYVGVIDILQAYDFWKKIERFWKVVICKKNGDGISCIKPHPYRRRFLSKMTDITEAVGDEWLPDTNAAAVGVHDSPQVAPRPVPVSDPGAEPPVMSTVIPLLGASGNGGSGNGSGGGGAAAPEQQSGIRERRCSVQVVGRSDHRYARSENAYTYNFPASWELLLWKVDQWGIKVLQQWPLAPRELWPTIARNSAGLTAGQSVQVVTPDGCRRVILLPPEFSSTESGPLRVPMPATELLVSSYGQRGGVILAKLITAATALEPALLAPTFFLMLGFDTYAAIAATTMLALSTFSQIPKRFLFRPRPYMVARARGFSKDPTTSFPSRAVTCGTVYATLIGFSVINRNSDMDSLLQEFNWLLLLVVLAVTGSTAWARIYLGAHYPSDCIFSIPQSFLIMLVAISLFYFEKAICGSCFRIVEPLDHAECYAAEGTSIWSATWSMVWLNLLAGALLTVFGTVCVLGASQPPLAFWDKIHYVYGLLLPCMTFRVTFTCPKLRKLFNPGATLEPFALPTPQQPNAADLIWAAAACAVLALIVVFNRRRASRAAKFAVFLALYVISLGMALVKRSTTVLDH